MKINNFTIASKLYKLIFYIEQDIEKQQKSVEFWLKCCKEDGYDTVMERDIEGRTYRQLLDRAKDTVTELEKEISKIEDMINTIQGTA